MAYYQGQDQHGGGGYGGGYDEGYSNGGYDGVGHSNQAYNEGAYGDAGYGYGAQDAQQWPDPPPQQRRPPPQGYDNYSRGGPGRGGPPRNDGYAPRGAPPSARGQPPMHNQGYDQGFDSTPPFSPADGRGDGRRYNGPPRPAPGRAPNGPPLNANGGPRHGDRPQPQQALSDEYNRRPPPGEQGRHSTERQHGASPHDRIVETPTSPDDHGWDNPFPTFPTKKAKAKEAAPPHDRQQGSESTHARRQHGAQGDNEPPNSLPGSRQRRNGVDQGGSLDLPAPPRFALEPGEQRSNTMPDREFPDLGREMPYRGPKQAPNISNEARSFSFNEPLQPPKPLFEPRRADSAGALERFEPSSQGQPDYGGHPQHGHDQYADVFDDYGEHGHGSQDPWSPGEEMPNFDAPNTAPAAGVDALHIGGGGQNQPPGRGHDMNRGAPHELAHSRSQPNFHQPPPQAYGAPPEMPPLPQGGYGPGGYGPPPNSAGGYERSETWSSGATGPSDYGGPGPHPPRGPPRGPPGGQLPKFKPRPQQGPGPGYGPGNSQQRGLPVGGPMQPQNPDALPSHPAPVRPGLMQQPPGPPPGQAPPRQGTAPMRPPMGAPTPGIMRAETMQAPISASAPLPQKPQAMPVTMDELRGLKQHVSNQPGDQAATLELAKKLVEAASTLIGDKGRVDPKTRMKNRERFLGEAFKHLKKLAAYSYPDAMFFLADCYGRDVGGGRGLFGAVPDQKEAFTLYQAAAKANHGQAAYRVAVCCEMGQDDGGGTRRDPLKALQWYRRAAALGDPPAMYKMGIILLKGLLGQQRNAREAIGYLQQAAERADADNPHALHELGLLFESGSAQDGVQRDEGYARQLFVQGAQVGYKFSQFRLGAAFEFGTLGCPVDPRQSIAWYSKAATQEEHQSELALSGWYLTGSDGIIQQSDTEAYLWARKAAQAGLSKAEYAMGYFTEVGIGAPADLESAKRWYWRAASQNYPKARERLEDLRKGGARMQKSQVSRSDVKNTQGECSVM